MTPAEHAAAMRELLADPAALTRRADARDAHGQPAPFDSPYAKSWCLHGALNRVVPAPERHGVWVHLCGFLPAGVALAQFADRGSHEDVVGLLERAAA